MQLWWRVVGQQCVVLLFPREIKRTKYIPDHSTKKKKDINNKAYIPAAKVKPRLQNEAQRGCGKPQLIYRQIHHQTTNQINLLGEVWLISFHLRVPRRKGHVSLTPALPIPLCINGIINHLKKVQYNGPSQTSVPSVGVAAAPSLGSSSTCM